MAKLKKTKKTHFRRRSLAPPRDERHAKTSPQKPKRGVAVEGVWAFNGDPPKIRFKITPHPKRGLNVKLSLPRKDVTLPESVWKSFFRFMALTLHTVRPSSFDEKVKDWIREERSARRKKWRSRHIRGQRTLATAGKVKPAPKVDLTPPVEPSTDLIQLAQQALKERKGEA